MNRVEYPFTKDKNGDIRPFVPIAFINPENGKSVKYNALIDTGADYCAFPKIVADRTGHNLKANGVQFKISNGIGGNNVPTWKHTFCLCLLDPSGKNILKTSDRMLVSCFEHNNAPPLLGGNDFMKDLEITFNYKKEVIIICWK